MHKPWVLATGRAFSNQFFPMLHFFLRRRKKIWYALAMWRGSGGARFGFGGISLLLSVQCALYFAWHAWLGLIVISCSLFSTWKNKKKEWKCNSGLRWMHKMTYARRSVTRRKARKIYIATKIDTMDSEAVTWMLFNNIIVMIVFLKKSPGSGTTKKSNAHWILM